METEQDELDLALAFLPNAITTSIDDEQFTITVDSRPGRCGTIHGNGRKCQSIISAGRFTATSNRRAVKFSAYTASVQGIINTLKYELDHGQRTANPDCR
jgi:hypothetical protein